MVIIWSSPAREDLRLLHQHIAHDSRYYAQKVVQDIVTKADILLETPRIGRVVPEFYQDEIREIGMYSYRIIYELSGDTIYIHGIFHKRQNFKGEDLERPES